MRRAGGMLAVVLLLTVLGGCKLKPVSKAEQAQAEAAGEDASLEYGQRDVTALEAKVSLSAIQSKLSRQCPLRALWSVPFPELTIKALWVPPARTRYDYLLVLSEAHDLIAIQRQNGMPLWWTELGGAPLGPPAYTPYGLYVIANGYLLNIERYSGQVVWRQRLGFPATPYMHVLELEQGKPLLSMVASNGVIRGLTVQRSVWPPRHGHSELSQEDIAIQRYSLRTEWQYKTQGLVEGPVSVRDGVIYAADSARRVYALNAAAAHQGRPAVVWKAITRGANDKGIIGYGSYLYLASRDRNLYCYARQTGNEVWRYESGHLFAKTPVRMRDAITQSINVFAVARDGPLFCLDGKRGDFLWSCDNGVEVVGFDIDTDRPKADQMAVLVQRADNTITASHFRTGGELWSVSPEVVGFAAANIVDQAVYAVSPNRRSVMALGRSR